MAAVTWFLLSLLGREVLTHRTLSYILSTMRAVVARLNQLAGAISQYPSLNWSNIGFLLILTTGTFLSMAAITSLPRLRESSKANSDVNAESLKRDLAELQLTDAQIAGYYGNDTPTEIIAIQSVLPGTGDTQTDKTDGPLTPGASTPGEGRATESAAVAQKAEPEANNASKRGETPSVERPDSARNSKVATADGAKASKKEETDRGSTLAAAKANLAAATTEEERARDEYYAVLWSAGNENKRLELQRTMDAARRRVAAARDEVEIANEQLRLVGQVEEQGSRLRAAWSGLIWRGQSLKEFVRTDGAQSMASAVREYSVQNIERHGSREEIAHFLRIRNWFAEKMNSHREALSRCGRRLRLGSSTGATWMSTVRRALVKPDNLVVVYINSSAVFEQTGSATDTLTADVCDIPFSMPIPQPPPLGDSLGPLRFIAGWLLNAASVPLALIVGLVGFGLLGAAISTFVREQLDARMIPVPPEARHVIVSDLAGVALRGISAAIVVFLAVQGGLAVLSGASSDPNPYVLLLACFVAAVFSERVWRRTYEHLQNELARGDRTRVEIIEAKRVSLPPKANSAE